MDAGGGPPPPPPEINAFKRLVVSCGKKKANSNHQKFVKKSDSIPSVEMPVELPCRTALNLANRGLIGQFTVLWPSPKAIDGWV